MSDLDWRSMPSLSSLRAFEATARTGSFSAAARGLNVTHAAVAQNVRGLEAAIGVVLLRREGRGVALTPEGERLAQALAEGFGAIAAGIAAARQSGQDRGLRVTATPALTQAALLPKLGAFWAMHPEIAVSLTPDYGVSDLARDGFDLGIRSGNGDWPGVESEWLADAKMIVVGAPALLERGTDLAGLPWLIDPADPNEPRWLAQAGLDPSKLTIRSLLSPMLAVGSVAQGYGLCFVTDIVVRDDLSAGRLVQVPFPDVARFRYWIVTPPGPRRAAVTIFTDWLKREFRPAES